MSIEASTTPPAPRRRVAVIAVHGVGSPPAGQTARNVTDLLIRSSGITPRYRRFEEHPLYIPIAPLDSGLPPSAGASSSVPQASSGSSGVLPASGASSGSADAERAKPHVAKSAHAKGRTNLGMSNGTTRSASSPDHSRIEEAALRPDIAFSRQLLDGYESEREPYKTIETIGTREDPGGDVDVHVFEMHWADLSRLGQGLFRLFGSAYQLIQHLSQIGRNTVDVAAQVADAYEKLEDPKYPASDVGPYTQWKRFANAHAFVIWIFTLWIPVITLLMLAFVPLFIPAAISVNSSFVVGLVAWAVVAIIFGALLMYFGPERRRAATLFVGFMALCLAVATFLSAHVSAGRQHEVGTFLITTIIGLLTLAGLLGVVRLYDRTHPRALIFVIASLAAVWGPTTKTAAALLGHLTLDPAERVRQTALIGFQQAYLVLMVFWLVLWCVVMYTMLRRFLVVRSTTGAARSRAARSAFTARSTLALSTFGFIVTALVWYRMLVYLAERFAKSLDLLPRALPLAGAGPGGALPTVHIPVFMPHDFPCPVGSTRPCAALLFDYMIASGGTSGFAIMLFGVALVLVLMSWFFVIIAATSIRKPDPKLGNGRRLGLWMTDGFRWLRVAGSTLGATVLLSIIVGMMLDLVPPFAHWVQGHAPAWLATVLSRAWTLTALNKVTIAVLASAATLGAARVRVEALASKARPALGVVLDVDHYLREDPKKGTPRARMFERFVSLLRYIQSRPQEERFDRVVIVAHSQGTVITADLLRFLAFAATDSDLELVSPERFRLLTIGSPLRQLYGVNFPYLYRWVNDTDPAPGEAHDATATPAIDDRTPDPALLRVGEWVNLYTSGDYVGRNLWTDDEWEEVWDFRPATKAIVGKARRERCLGAGTHTYYWTDPEVGAELDRLIV